MQCSGSLHAWHERTLCQSSGSTNCQSLGVKIWNEMDYNDHIEHYKVDGEYYDYFAFSKFMVAEINRRYQEFLNLSKPAQNAVILDIGSGGGGVSSLIEERNAKYFPLDISDNNLKRIKELSTINTFPVNGDTYHLPFKKDSVNLIMMSEIIEHLANPVKALEEVARILKEDGQLVVSVPYKEQISYQICIHCNKPKPTHSHLHSFTVETFRDLLIQAGLKPVKFSKNLNKVINRLHINYLFRSLPFRIWKIVDSVFNSIIDKPTSMIFVCKK